jgi:hypothetical protein
MDKKKRIKNLVDFSYLGNVLHSSKHSKAIDYNELTYSIYLAPGNLSGHEVCAGRNEECTKFCLNESGKNRMDTGNITRARIARTKLFFDDRELFMALCIGEIYKYKGVAAASGLRFSVRLNNTSDLSPEIWRVKYEGGFRNILEIFPDVQFYDYTKVFPRLKLVDKYPNYDLTFSYSGTNWDRCEEALAMGVRVAVPFEEVPVEFRGYKVINGDNYDMRYWDEPGVIVGLKYKKVRNKLSGTEKFVVFKNQL